MNSFIEAVRRVRADMTYVDMAKRTGVSRQTLMAMEAGLPTKLSTLRLIAERCQLSDDVWDELLAAWVEFELGPKDFARLNQRLSPKFEAADEPEKLLLTTFKRLNSSEQQAVLLSMLAKPVRDLLPGLNQLLVLRESGLSHNRKLRQEFPEDYRKMVEEYFGSTTKPPKDGMSLSVSGRKGDRSKRTKSGSTKASL